MLYIPAYWWYSIEYSDDTVVCVFKYNTYMNHLAMAPDIIKYVLQKQNVQRKIVPTIDMNEHTKQENNGVDAHVDTRVELEQPDMVMENGDTTAIGTTNINDIN